MYNGYSGYGRQGQGMSPTTMLLLFGGVVLIFWWWKNRSSTPAAAPSTPSTPVQPPTQPTAPRPPAGQTPPKPTVPAVAAKPAASPKSAQPKPKPKWTLEDRRRDCASRGKYWDPAREGGKCMEPRNCKGKVTGGRCVTTKANEVAEDEEWSYR